MRLVRIPKDRYDEYRLNVMFDAYKWDPQFEDNNTVAGYALVLSKDEHNKIKELTEAMDAETVAAERLINQDKHLKKMLRLNRKLSCEIDNMSNYDATEHVRLMRYDFHPVYGEADGNSTGWAVSEVNSDVPGGFAESTYMAAEALKALEGICDTGSLTYVNFSDIITGAILGKVKNPGRIMMVHCTSYSDDRQVMQFLGDRLKDAGMEVLYGAADHIRFKDGVAYSCLDGYEGRLDAIFRFTPLEWLVDIKPKRWQGYFDTVTMSCNHPIAIYAQTKRFPLVWDELEKRGLSLKTWRQLLPDTCSVNLSHVKEGYIYKPAYGRVGENISIREACDDREYRQILKDVRRHPGKYIAQKRFMSCPVKGENESFHICIGSYTVDGKHAGYYARLSKTPRIDSNAADVPVLVETV